MPTEPKISPLDSAVESDFVEKQRGNGSKTHKYSSNDDRHGHSTSRSHQSKEREGDRDFREKDHKRERDDRHREREKDRDKDRDRERDRDRDRSRDKDRHRDRDRDNRRDRHHDRERDRDSHSHHDSSHTSTSSHHRRRHSDRSTHSDQDHRSRHHADRPRDSPSSGQPPPGGDTSPHHEQSTAHKTATSSDMDVAIVVPLAAKECWGATEGEGGDLEAGRPLPPPQTQDPQGHGGVKWSGGSMRALDVFFREVHKHVDSLSEFLPAQDDDAVVTSITEILFKAYPYPLKLFAGILWASQFFTLAALFFSLLPCPDDKIKWTVAIGIPLCCGYGQCCSLVCNEFALML